MSLTDGVLGQLPGSFSVSRVIDTCCRASRRRALQCLYLDSSYLTLLLRRTHSQHEETVETQTHKLTASVSVRRERPSLEAAPV